MIGIGRHVTGAKRRRRWRTYDDATIKIDLIMNYWKTQVIKLHLKPDATKQLFNITERTIEWWRAIQRIPTKT